MGLAFRNAMSDNTMYLPGFSGVMRRSRATKAAKQVMEQVAELSGLAMLMANFFPFELLALKDGGRNRMFTPMLTFMAFLGQVMTRNSSCRDAVKQVQMWYLAHSKSTPEGTTSGYCQARARLDLTQIRTAFHRVAEWFSTSPRSRERWHGHQVKVMDGTGISMPDTPQNRAAYEYAPGQKPGCGFPTGKLLGLFNLFTGHIHQFVQGNWKEHDISMARSVVAWMDEGDVVLADRGFCGWGLLALLARKNVHVVMRLHSARKTKASSESWAKPKRQETWEEELWDELPESLQVRIIRCSIEQPGMRTKQFTLVTTLLDTKRYPDQDIIDLYLRRWQVELNFRDIKKTLGLDVLRTKTPELVEKEIYMQAIAYNLVRAVMVMSSDQHDEDLRRMSFKGTVDTLRRWVGFMRARDPDLLRHRWHDMLSALASDVVPERPDRAEPRVVKRRVSKYQLLTKPRAQMVVSESRRDKGRRNASKRSLT